MNFFSHYYIDKEHPNPHFILGTLLPEFFPHFNQYLRKSFSQYQPETQQEIFLLKGIQQHYKIDAAFHNSIFFIENTKRIKEIILSNEALSGLNYRSYYLAHITLELLIDRVLLQHYIKEPKAFYDFLQNINLLPVAQLFSKNNKQQEYQVFENIFKRHLSQQYLFYYHNNEIFVEALLRLYLKINTHMQTVETKMAYSSIILALELELQQEIQIFVSKFKQHTKEQ